MFQRTIQRRNIFCYNVLFLLLLCNLIFVNKHRFASCCSVESLLNWNIKKHMHFTRGRDVLKHVHQAPVGMWCHQWSSLLEDEFVKDPLLALNSSGFHTTLRSLDQVKGPKQTFLGHISSQKQHNKIRKENDGYFKDRYDFVFVMWHCIITPFYCWFLSVNDDLQFLSNIIKIFFLSA